MDRNSINICVRVRPWHPEKELPFVAAPAQPQQLFLGEGAFVNSPRKPAGGSIREVIDIMDHRQLDFDKPEQGAEMRRGQPGAKRYKDKRYVFDRVFGMDATQEEVFKDSALPLLEGVLDGYNATVFAYGATGCGKTHTISGTQENPGITVRIMERLFEMIDASADEYDTEVEVTMVEIYNELIRDLLEEVYPNPKTPTGGLKLLENEKNRVTLANVTRKVPKTADDVMGYVLLGNGRRSTSYTASNSESSRSHAVLQIQVTRRSKGHTVDLDKEMVSQAASMATLSIIDLAGSERAAATQNLGARMKEGANINKSLLALSSCFSALCQAVKSGRKPPHVPYRDSKLTRMLKFSLGGNCRTVMIVCVSPSSRDIEDTHNTLVWADRAKQVKLVASRNTAGQPISVKQYLITIDQQAHRIKYLEGQVNRLASSVQELGKSASFAGSKLELSRKEAEQWLESAKRDLHNALPVIQTGAKQRAMWDTAQMRIEALKQTLLQMEKNKAGRSAEEVAKEREYINSIIRQQELAFGLNRSVTDSVQHEATVTATLNKMFKGVEDRTFEGNLDKRELAAYRTSVGTHRAELERQISIARERGYRESAQTQADAFAQFASMFHRFVSTLQDETDMLSGVAQTSAGSADMMSSIDRLQSLGQSTLADLATVFGKTALSATRALPPLPTATVQDGSHFPLLSPARRMPVSQHPVMGAQSNATRQRGSMAPNPAIQRVRNGSRAPGSPGKAGRVAPSPLKSALRREFKVGLSNKVGLKGRTPKKSARWKDEAGAGHLDDWSVALDAAVFSSPSEAEGDEEVAEDANVKLGDGSPAARRTAPPISLPKSVPPPPLTNPVPAPTSSIFGSAPAPAPVVPSWKQNRIMLGKTGSRLLPLSDLSPLGEEGESSPERSSPSSGPSRPSRTSGSSRLSRLPLVDRQENPPATTSDSRPESRAEVDAVFARLSGPTHSSKLKAEGVAPATSRMGPPSRRASSINHTARRSSTAGPYSASQQVRRSRGSLMPGDASLSGRSIDGLPTASDLSNRSINMTSSTMLGGAARRIPLNTAGDSSTVGRRSSLLPPSSMNVGSMSFTAGSAAPRQSMLSLGAPSRLPPNGPRPSMSMAALPKLNPGLASRPSMSSLRTTGMTASGSTGIVGGGDGSMPRWK